MSYKTPRGRVPTLDFDWRVLAVVWMRPGGGWNLWRFASLIPSGCRLTPIHKVMGDHASRGPTPPRLGFSYTWSLMMVISFHAM